MPNDPGQLSPRQHEVFTLLCEGHSYQQIAARLGISSSTVRSYAGAIYRQLGVDNIKQAITAAAELGWAPWSPPRERRRRGRPARDPLTTGALAEFDRWLASGFADQQARNAWHHGARALCARRGVKPGRQHDTNSPLRDLLHHVADATLNPTT